MRKGKKKMQSRQLKELMDSSASFAEGLATNARLHRSYNWYTSMDRALSFLETGELYLSSGKDWNDICDRQLMQERNAYGRCFSCSTAESIAMWMLYGSNGGKDGAMLSFLPSVIKEIAETEEIAIGNFDQESGSFVAYGNKHLSRAEGDFELLLTDIVYMDTCKNNKVKLSVWEEHCTTDETILVNDNVFYKNYAWSYEKECRLIARLSGKWSALAEKKDLRYIQIKLSKEALEKMNHNRLYRSPIYCGQFLEGRPSLLSDKVDWSL